MRRDDAIFLIADAANDARRFKMTKAKTALVLVMIISSCGLIFSITDAYPTPETENAPEEITLGNSSRLVITHVVKTIEFEVGIVDDDGKVDENSTDPNAGEFYETDIQLLNVDLLREVVNQATAQGNWEDSMNSSPDEEHQMQGQVHNDSLVQFNQTTS